jgi:hypothetical protein
MEVKFFAPRWGSENMTWPDFDKELLNSTFGALF